MKVVASKNIGIISVFPFYYFLIRNFTIYTIVSKRNTGKYAGQKYQENGEKHNCNKQKKYCNILYICS